MQPSPTVLRALILAHCRLGSAHRAAELFRDMRAMNYAPDVRLVDSLLRMQQLPVAPSLSPSAGTHLHLLLDRHHQFQSDSVNFGVAGAEKCDESRDCERPRVSTVQKIPTPSSRSSITAQALEKRLPGKIDQVRGGRG